jgi:hypothetical protein
MGLAGIERTREFHSLSVKGTTGTAVLILDATEKDNVLDLRLVVNSGTGASNKQAFSIIADPHTAINALRSQLSTALQCLNEVEAWHHKNERNRHVQEE